MRKLTIRKIIESNELRIRGKASFQTSFQTKSHILFLNDLNENSINLKTISMRFRDNIETCNQIERRNQSQERDK